MHDKVVHKSLILIYIFLTSELNLERAAPGANRDKLLQERIKIFKKLHKLLPGIKNMLIFKKLFKLLLHEKIVWILRNCLSEYYQVFCSLAVTDKNLKIFLILCTPVFAKSSLRFLHVSNIWFGLLLIHIKDNSI